MPISLSKVQERRKPLKVDLGDGDILNIVYRPAAYTADFEAAISDAAKDGDRSVIGRAVEALVEEWDVYEDDAQSIKFPIEAEAIGRLPLVVLRPMLDAIGADMRPKAKNEGSFASGSEG